MPVKEAGMISIEGNDIKVTSLDKLLWPKLGITKYIYLQKLVSLAPYLLLYCSNRYLTSIRYPDGVNGKSFYQKNAPHPYPSFVTTAKKEDVNYVHLDSMSTLLWLGNLAALEFHTSFEYIGGEEAAEWVLDIDPSKEQEPRLMEAISIIGEALQAMGIHSIPKTSGATGVQIIIPITPNHTFEQLKILGRFVGEYLVEKNPNLFTIERLIKNRGDNIYIDYIQHGAGKSISAPYTPRARADATVSTPLTWDEVHSNINPKQFNLLTIEDRLKEKGDLITRVEKQDLNHIIQRIQ